MALDVKRLMRDAGKAQAARPGTAIGRETTGVTRAVRGSLSAIRKLREAGVTWKAIAEAMTAQGITQSGGKALTATRLTAIVSDVEAQMRRPARDLVRRGQRSDLAPGAGDACPGTASMARAAQVQRPKAGLRPPSSSDPTSGHPAHAERPATEAEIRRAGLAELQQILKGVK